MDKRYDNLINENRLHLKQLKKEFSKKFSKLTQEIDSRKTELEDLKNTSDQNNTILESLFFISNMNSSKITKYSAAKRLLDRKDLLKREYPNVIEFIKNFCEDNDDDWLNDLKDIID